MRDESRFRSDLFKGTAHYYAQYRPQYPQTLFTHLLQQVSGRDRLLDIACGTGQASVPLSKAFGEVLAIDQEPEMIEYARRLHPNVKWIVGKAETIEVDDRFDLVTVGNAYHRLNRHAVAHRAATLLKTDGCMAILWSNGPWADNADWQLDVASVVRSWEERLAVGRVPEGWREAMDDEPTENVLESAGLVYEGTFTFPVRVSWTVDSLVGFVYSTSTLNRLVLRGYESEFERDIRQIGIGPFIQRTSAAYELARLPSNRG